MLLFIFLLFILLSNIYKENYFIRDANNFENLERAVTENKIDIILQNEDENLKELKYLLELKQYFK